MGRPKLAFARVWDEWFELKGCVIADTCVLPPMAIADIYT